MNITTTALYDALSEKLDRPTAKLLTDYVEEKVRDEVNDMAKTLATKADLADVKGELRTEIERSRATLLWAMFGFWVAQLAALFGFILLFIKK